MHRQTSNTPTFLGIIMFVMLTAATQAFAGYAAVNYVSDIPGAARRTDTNLVNPWGIAVSSGGTIWVANNGTGTSTLYDQNGVPQDLVVEIPASETNSEGANPTGTVFNSGTGFVVSDGTNSGPSLFIFVSEDGSISGWNPVVSPDHAIIAVDDGDEGAVYKGAALAESSSGLRLYVTNFSKAEVSVYDDTFAEIEDEEAFVDPDIPRGYAPFGIENIGGLLYVTYAKQDRDGEDDVPGPGHGFVDVFNADVGLVKRLVTRGALNSPWGLALAPASHFGNFNGALLVGNFGDGRIHGYDLTTGAFLGTMRKPDRVPLALDELWALHTIGNEVFFTAGIVEEEHGLFGVIRSAR